MEVTKKYELNTYYSNECCSFRKTKEEYGGLSNMASGFPLNINGINVLSSEALYQTCRFPHLPEVQKKIISERSPMSAKMVGKPFRTNSRPDWDEVKIKIMRWCLRVKIAQNFMLFGQLLESTQNRPIVEDSNKDDFWGAVRSKDDQNVLIGVNALGRLLMELRQFYNEKRFSYDMFVVKPLNIPDFKFYGSLIRTIDERENFISYISKSIKYYEINNKNPYSSNNLHNEFGIHNNVLNDPEVPYKVTKKEKKEKKLGNNKKDVEQQASLPL